MNTKMAGGLSSIIISTIIISTIHSSDAKCKCVQLEQCRTNYGEGLLDVRLYQNHTCPKETEICCKYDGDHEEKIPTKQIIGTCGYQNFWYSSLFFKPHKKEHMKYRCTVSLINPKAILTAAHCLSGNGTFFIKVGKFSKTVDKMIIHPDYNQITRLNDIAILILTTPVILNRRINTNCLPSQNMVIENKICQAASWTTKHLNNRLHTYLKIIKYKIITKKDCLKSLSTTKLATLFLLHNNFLCAKAIKEEDVCESKFGSPLICPVEDQPGRNFQIGLASWGIGCQNNRIPGVYVLLSNYKNWIDEEITKLGLESASYTF